MNLIQHLKASLSKGKYFIENDKIKVISISEKLAVVKVGSHEVLIDDRMRVSCSCKWGSLHPGSLCSHVISVCYLLLNNRAVGK